jgi:hypothetical protein
MKCGYPLILTHLYYRLRKMERSGHLDYWHCFDQNSQFRDCCCDLTSYFAVTSAAAGEDWHDC